MGISFPLSLALSHRGERELFRATDSRHRNPYVRLLTAVRSGNISTHELLNF